MCYFFHLYILEKYFKDKFTKKQTFSHTHRDTIPIWGNTDVLGQNGLGKVNRSRPTN